MKPIDIYQIKVGNPQKPGATIYAQGVNFAVEVLANQKVSLLLYDKKGEMVQEIPFPDNCRVGHMASLFIEKFSYHEYEYAYRIGENIVPDAYARRVADGRSGFVDEEDIVSGNEVQWIPFEEMILYKLHVRGFSKLAGNSIKKKGTFAGIEEAIPYFQELGINAIEFMPMYEWTDEGNYWGYAPVNYYFAPKAAYAAKDAIGECRQMIQALHEAGLECIMEFYFPEGTNPTLVIDALIYWKLHYGVDGYHLIGEGVPAQMLVQMPLLKKTKLFFDRAYEQWMRGDTEPLYKNIAEYNNDFMNCGRRLLKSDEWQTANFIRQLRKNPEKHGAVNYMANNNGFTLKDMVCYNEKHNEANGEGNRDGMPADDVWNCGTEGPTNEPDINAFRLKQMKNAMLYTLLSQGIPLIYQGDEFGNSQNGNNNAYAMDNETGWVNWQSFLPDFQEFVKEVIAFRKAHPVLHQRKMLRMADYKGYRYPDISYHGEAVWYPKLDGDSRSVACMYCGKYAEKMDGTQDDFIYVAYNAYWEKKAFALPKLPNDMTWKLAIQTEVAEETGLAEGEAIPNQETLPVTPRTVVVLIGK